MALYSGWRKKFFNGFEEIFQKSDHFPPKNPPRIGAKTRDTPSRKSYPHWL
jgi:hypothetical protein